MQTASTIGLIELPVLGLIDSYGKNWLSDSSNASTLISKQVLLSSLQAEGFDAQMVNIRDGDYVGEYGKTVWCDVELTKAYLGKKITDIDPLQYDAWGITNNFVQDRQIALIATKHLSSKGTPVVVGGSDVIAEAHAYLAAGAAAVVMDKSGAANGPIMNHVLGKSQEKELSGVILRKGPQPPMRAKNPMSPEDWPLPDVTVARQCLGFQYKGFPLAPERSPIGSVFTDIGCDRRCDFCQTPSYHLGYKAMSPERVLEWFQIQRQAGARSVFCSSDQFLGRILRKNGRQEILEIMQGIRGLDLAVFWNNGLELRKMTKNHGLKRRGADLTPDDELISALYGWNGKNGCYFAYIPAERPVVGRQNYKKLLPWKQHIEILKAIVDSGVPYLRYGVIIGFEDDSEESLLHLEEALSEMCEVLFSLNPSLQLQVSPFSICPIPGSPQGKKILNSGLLQFDDTSLFGSLWMPSVNTRYLGFEEIAKWQVRLSKIGNPYMGV